MPKALMTEGMKYSLRKLAKADPKKGRTARGMGAKSSVAQGLVHRGYAERCSLDGERDTYWITEAGRKAANKLLGPGERWEQGIDHDPRSEEIYKAIAKIDFEECSDSFCFKNGGDGDNGETLMFLMDCYFARREP